MGVQCPDALRLSLKVCPSCWFKALVTDARETVPKMTATITSIHPINGDGAVKAGSRWKANYANGNYIVYDIDILSLDHTHYQYAVTEGNFYSNNVEMVTCNLKLDKSSSGGCDITAKTTYYTKGDSELTDEEIANYKDIAKNFYQLACEPYLLEHADPVCLPTENDQSIN